MDDLPELPFEKVLSYLSLEDRLKARAVSRRWYHMVNRFRVKTLCYSERPSGFIRGKRRWVSSTFVQNFISSTRFTMFFDTFGQTIFSSLKHLRLCDLHLDLKSGTAFSRILNLFGQLEELDIIRAELNQLDSVLSLTLPMLTSLQFKEARGIQDVTLEAPRLQKVAIVHSPFLTLEIVHGDSIEKLLIYWFKYTDVKKLKNLQYLYVSRLPDIDPTLLSSLQQLKEFHTNDPKNVSELFEQKRRYERVDLKIYLRGLLLNGPDDPAMDFLNESYDYLNGEWLVYLTENPSRLADEIPFFRSLDYSDIEEGGFVDLEVNVLKRFIDLDKAEVRNPAQNIQFFQDLLKYCENIDQLEFDADQPQELFDRLPEHSAVQWLRISSAPFDLAFLFRLKHLFHLHVSKSIDSETVRRAFEELPVLSSFGFQHGQKEASIEIDKFKQFDVSVFGEWEMTFSELNAAIEFIFGNERPKKRKIDALE